MDIDDAVKAVELLAPRLTVPMHYDTFDLIKADPGLFIARLEKIGARGRKLAVGEELTLD